MAESDSPNLFDDTPDDKGLFGDENTTEISLNDDAEPALNQDPLADSTPVLETLSPAEPDDDKQAEEPEPQVAPPTYDNVALDGNQSNRKVLKMPDEMKSLFDDPPASKPLFDDGDTTEVSLFDDPEPTNDLLGDSTPVLLEESSPLPESTPVLGTLPASSPVQPEITPEPEVEPTPEPAELDLNAKSEPVDVQKSEDELLEEESGDTFEINFKVSDPMKVGDGMSAYMAYNVTTSTSIPSFKASEFSVKRRFSDFLGLHERLNEKHILQGRIVPPPPDKSLVGMVKVKGAKEDQSSSEFVERRKHQLEKFLNRVGRHPQLREDPDFKEFIEAEELPRAKNTSALSKGGLARLAKSMGDAVSKMTTKMTETDQWFEEKHNQIETLDSQLKKLHIAAEQLYRDRKETCLMTASFAKSLSLLSNSEEHTGLSRALSTLAELEEKIEHIQQEQATKELYDLAEVLREYLGLVSAVKASFQQRAKTWQNWQNSQATLTKKREALAKLELAQKQDKIGPAKEEVDEWVRRVEKGEEDFGAISKEIKVEVARFENCRVKDFRDLIINYLQSLLGVQQQLVKVWEGFQPEAKSIH